uniref:1-aminocyclopropane-1-carboxylate oxidase n=1 Tax=Ananas comosus var. bracteatus TaxID=296719 RepID=A0A6V7QTI7_ANACO
MGEPRLSQFSFNWLIKWDWNPELRAFRLVADFYSDFTITWGGGHATIYNRGEDLQLMMDRASGSGGESKTAFLFGRFDVQIKLIPGNSAGTDEIDFEFLGSNSSYVLHTNIYTGGNGGREQQFHFWFDPTADFHTYSILWNPQQIIWYVDGMPIRVFKNANVSEVAYPENQPMKIHASLWDGSNWIGPIDWSKAPFIAHYHGYSYTACVWTGTLDGEKRRETMSLLHEACAKWGFFWRVKKFANAHYEDFLKQKFYNSELAKGLGPQTKAAEVDWECTYYLQHQPVCNINDFPDITAEFRQTMDEYIKQLVKVAEKLAESLSENLGLEIDYLKRTFSPPFVGTKVAIYPQCPEPEYVTGFRAHTDAGGIILLLQDDTVPGLEFFKDGEWVPISPTKDNRIFVNIGDQIEVVSNGTYKSILHRVTAPKEGNRLSIATFYNPGNGAVISPVPKLLYPSGYRFQEYLEYYFGTKFSDKVARFQTLREVFK